MNVALLKDLFNKNQFKDCFARSDECSERIIVAHSIQNNKILKKISDNGILLSLKFDFDNESGQAGYNLGNQGRKIASTFTGFCGYHDQVIFRPIELTDYIPGNREQEFLYAYRSFAKGYYAKKTVLNSYKQIDSWFKSDDIEMLNQYIFSSKEKYITDEMNRYYHFVIKPFVENTELTVNQLEEDQIAFNINLNKNNFHKISSFTIIFNQEYKFASSSMITLFEDLDGHTFNDLSPNARLKFMFINIFPQNGLTYVIFSYYSKDKKSFEKIKNQILSKNEIEQKIITTKIITKYVENFFISPTKWDSLSNEIKEIFLGNSFETSTEGTPINELPDVNVFT